MVDPDGATQPIEVTTDQVVSDQRLEVRRPQDPNLPINRLPIELLLHIFHNSGPGIKRRLIISHVCQQWRSIALASGSLWTNIRITPPLQPTDKGYSAWIALLDLQLERSQSFPLDVFWRIRNPIFLVDATVDLLRRKGQFHRWRSLSLWITTEYKLPMLPDDSFSNLESFTVLSVKPHELVATINHTTTSKLQTLDIRRSGTQYEDIERLYGTMLKRVSRLILPVLRGLGASDTLPSIPANVVDVEARSRSNHQFPHVKTYKLTTGIFRSGNTFDLRSLVTLIVIDSFTMEKDCHMTLPSLHRFVCGHIKLSEGAVLDAPQLVELEFRTNSTIFAPGPIGNRFNYIENILSHQGFLLSPAKSLLLEPSLPTRLIIRMLIQYSCLENLELEFGDDMTVWNVTVALGGKMGKSGALCPQLTELRLRIAPEYRDRHRIDWWKDRADQIVRGRKDCAAALRISYGGWDRGETFALLA